MNENIKDLAHNPFIVREVINTINSQYPQIIELYNPSNPHKQPYSYFMTGGCSNYAEILTNIFQEQVDGYYLVSTDGSHTLDHVITKIGDYYYDVNGMKILSDYLLFEAYPPGLDSLEQATLAFGRHTDADNIIIEKLSEIGIAKFREIIEENTINKTR